MPTPPLTILSEDPGARARQRFPLGSTWLSPNGFWFRVTSFDEADLMVVFQKIKPPITVVRMRWDSPKVGGWTPGWEIGYRGA